MTLLHPRCGVVVPKDIGMGMFSPGPICVAGYGSPGQTGPRSSMFLSVCAALRLVLHMHWQALLPWCLPKASLVY